MTVTDRTTELHTISTVRLWCRNGLARKIREEASLTIREVAELAQTDPQTLYRWERNERTPRGANALRYHRALVQLQEITRRASLP